MAVAVTEKSIKKRKVKKVKDHNAPKPPLTAFVKFGNEQRKVDQALNALPFGKQSQLLSEMWKNSSEEFKNKLKEEYFQEKEKYDKEMEEYKKTESYKQWKAAQDAVNAANGKPVKKKNNLSAYNIYFKEQFAILSDTNKEVPKKEFPSLISKQWKELSDEDKKVYQQKADALNKENKGLNMPVESKDVTSEEETVDEE